MTEVKIFEEEISDKSMVDENYFINIHTVKNVKFIIMDLYDQDALINSVKIPEMMSNLLKNKDGSFDGTIYDLRMGPHEVGQKCGTCKNSIDKCITHPGKITLRIPIYNPSFIKYIAFLMNIFKFQDFIDDGHLEFIYDIKTVEKNLVNASDIDTIMNIFDSFTPRIPKIYSDKNDTELWKMIVKKRDDKLTEPVNIFHILRFLKALDEYMIDGKRFLERIGFGGTQVRNYILRVLDVYPPKFRPLRSINKRDAKVVFNTYYQQIIKANLTLRDILLEEEELYVNIDERSSISTQAKALIKTIVKNYKYIMDNKKESSVKQLIGSKEGLFRGGVESHVVSGVSRSVLYSAPDIEIDQIKVGYNVAKKWTTGIIITDKNFDEVKSWITNGLVKKWKNSYDQVFYINKTPVVKGGLKPVTKDLKTSTVTLDQMPLIEKFLMISDVYTCKINGVEERVETGGKFKGDLNLTTEKYLEELGKRMDKFNQYKKRCDTFIFYKAKEKIYHLPAKLRIGDMVHRRVRNDDIVLVNRQPSIHRLSFVGLRLLITPPEIINYAIGMNPGVFVGLNADKMTVCNSKQPYSCCNTILGKLCNYNLI